jgi:glycosyltransferase involved in cell wall biosynthesis
VLVVPSHYEGYGIVLAEAASHGLAIVATRAGAIPEVVRDGRESVLVPPRNLLALGNALHSVVTDARRRERMQRAAFERAGELPTWAETCASFARALDLCGRAS